MEEKVLNSFLAQQKEPLNKQNSLTRYYSTYLRFLEGFLITMTTTQGTFSSIRYQITCKIRM